MDKKYQFGDVEVELPEFNFKKVVPVFILAIFLFLVYNSAYSIQADEQGVLLRLGKYNSTIQPGLHFKIPIIGFRKSTLSRIVLYKQSNLDKVDRPNQDE